MENRPLTKRALEDCDCSGCALELVQSAKRLLKHKINKLIFPYSQDYYVLGLLDAEKLIDACFQIPDGDEKDVD